MLEIVLCEDNSRTLNNLELLIDRIIKKNKINGKIVLKADNPDSIEEYIKNKSANVFFLDIELKTLNNGYELARKVREKFVNAYIIFITAHLEFVFHSFKVKPFDFLPKPVTEEIIEQCLKDVYNDYIRNCNIEKDKVIEVKSGQVIYKVKVNDIIYIEKSDTKTIIHLAANIIQCCENLDKLEKMVDSKDLVRCHKSYMCNKSYISEIRLKTGEIIFETGHSCLLGRKYRKGF